MNFLELGLSPVICKALGDIGYTTPTPVQQMTIPHVLCGKDILVSAQTGTGKTASFLLPLLDKLINGTARARIARAIILEPTRELALQVMQAFQQLNKEINLKAALIVGGESMQEQQRILSRGVDILIATPGRLLDIMGRGQLLLLGVQHLIIDEADRMLDMGFMPDINKIMAALPQTKQTMLFSATFPKEIKKLAETYLNNPENIEVSPTSSTATTIKQCFAKVQHLDKKYALKSIINQYSEGMPSIVFCNRTKDINGVVKVLQDKGHQVSGLHGKLPQSVRIKIMDQFKKGDIKVLVASDVAARGVDVENLKLVVNFDVPNQAEDYVHRIGRTGRAGQTGMAVSLVSKEEQKAWQIVEKTINMQPELIDWRPNEHKQPEANEATKDQKKSTVIAAEKEFSKKRSSNKKHSSDKHSNNKEEAHNLEAKNNVVNFEKEKSLRDKSFMNKNSSGKHSDGGYNKKDNNSPVATVIGFGDFTPAFMLR